MLEGPPLTPRTQRRLGWLLFAALLPMLTFFGHWPAFELDIPGTGAYIRLPGAPAAARTARPDQHGTSSAPGHDHTQHCHGDAAGCSDAPAAGMANFQMLLESCVLIGAAGMFVLAVVVFIRRRGCDPARPDAPPPRLLAAY